MHAEYQGYIFNESVTFHIVVRLNVQNTYKGIQTTQYQVLPLGLML